MERMIGPKRPFYKAGPVMRLEKIPSDIFARFIDSRFTRSGIRVEPGFARGGARGRGPAAVRRAAARARGVGRCPRGGLAEGGARPPAPDAPAPADGAGDRVRGRMGAAHAVAARGAARRRARRRPGAALGGRAPPAPARRRLDGAGRARRAGAGRTWSRATAAATPSSIRCCASGSCGGRSECAGCWTASAWTRPRDPRVGDVRLGELRVPVHHHHGGLPRLLRLGRRGRPARRHGHRAVRDRHHDRADDHRARLARSSAPTPTSPARKKRMLAVFMGVGVAVHGGDVLHRAGRLAPRARALRHRQHRRSPAASSSTTRCCRTSPPTTEMDRVSSAGYALGYLGGGLLLVLNLPGS